MTVLDRFLHYVSFETTATEERDDACSNPLILNLTNELLKELEALHPDEISVNRFGVIDAKFNGDTSKPAIALLAHMDTSENRRLRWKRCRASKGYDSLHGGVPCIERVHRP